MCLPSPAPPSVNYTIPGAVHHITITPASANVVAGERQQFTAIAYDVNNNPISGLGLDWSVVNGGGTILSSTGRFTAGTTLGTYSNTVQASAGG